MVDNGIQHVKYTMQTAATIVPVSAHTRKHTLIAAGAAACYVAAITFRAAKAN